jgi:hypothetical protein
MPRGFRVIALVLTLCFLVACSAAQWSHALCDQGSDWVGRRADDLVVAWGPPTEIVPQSDGGSIYGYAHVDQWTLWRLFRVDQNGIINGYSKRLE